MSSDNVRAERAHLDRWRASDWAAFGLILLGALALRLLFFSGYLGSDDINSSEAAFAITQGQWFTSDYPGNIRYGINIPIAIAISVFGFTEFTANLWTLVCSVGEVGLVFVAARMAWGTQAAVYAATLLALTPIHVNWGGRMTGDAPLAFWISLSILLFWVAERRPHPAIYFGAGLAAGAVYWIKEGGPVSLGLLAIYAMVNRRWSALWLWGAAGCALLVAANLALFQALTGNALFIFKVMADRRPLMDTLMAAGDSRTVQSVGYYFRYLFLDLRHTWLLGYLAAAAVGLWAIRRWRDRIEDGETRFVVVWALGLIGLFTFMVIRFTPVTLIFKQVNYMLIFLAPLAMLGGFVLDRLGPRTRGAVITVVAGGSLLLAAFQQQAALVFTANSRAAWIFAKEHKTSRIFGTVHAQNMASVFALMENGGKDGPTIRPLSELVQKTAAPAQAPLVGPGEAPEAYVLLDQETIGWGKNPKLDERSVPGCWEMKGRLTPRGFGLSAAVTRGVQAMGERLPGPVGRAVGVKLGVLLTPKPALVYRVPKGCEFRHSGEPSGGREGGQRPPSTPDDRIVPLASVAVTLVPEHPGGNRPPGHDSGGARAGRAWRPFALRQNRPWTTGQDHGVTGSLNA